MAGFTHSAFRRLVADFGGYGALCTEMLCGPWLLHENLRTSPATRRRPEEGHVIYQLMVASAEEARLVIGRLRSIEPVAIELNLACPAPVARQTRTGGILFQDRERLASVLMACRQEFAGPLTVKIRLGRPEGWESTFEDRLRLFEDTGVDAFCLHPRFADEHLRGRARTELYDAIANSTRLPLLASGDIKGARSLREEHYRNVAGILVGRAAIGRPWLFSRWGRPALGRDYREIWDRMLAYSLEDFTPGKALYRMKAFTRYYATNFFFGNTLDAVALSSSSLDVLVAKTRAFLDASPRPMAEL
jgi:tRNA-dihydrouridine synthase